MLAIATTFNIRRSNNREVFPTRVWRVDEFRGLEGLRLHEEPTHSPQWGEVLLRVWAVSLNYRDIAMPFGIYPSPSEVGYIPTSDAAAEMVAIGESVRIFQPGDRVISSFHRRRFGGPQPAGSEMDGHGALEACPWRSSYDPARPVHLDIGKRRHVDLRSAA
ncbi:alcohol dehydrogenase catalytic domain-containing protein [Lichenicola cladoniae]|uniref:alcohol dehydrogenase catalytic domain-containing protein n=1 Tax=Lichenicola cladoniae TaxID=1484109 RepID=UPI0038CFE295